MCIAKCVRKHKKFVAIATLSVAGSFKVFSKYPCNNVSGKIIQVYTVKMHSRQVNARQKERNVILFPSGQSN